MLNRKRNSIRSQLRESNFCEGNRLCKGRSYGRQFVGDSIVGFPSLTCLNAWDVRLTDLLSDKIKMSEYVGDSQGSGIDDFQNVKPPGGHIDVQALSRKNVPIGFENNRACQVLQLKRLVRIAAKRNSDSAL